MKVFEEKEFIDSFLDVRSIGVCYPVEIVKRWSNKTICKANIKITESNEVKDCSISTTPESE